MKGIYRIILILACAGLLLQSCKKEPVNQLSLLPPATQTGANTFGCLVNGAAYVPKNESLVGGAAFKCQFSFSEHGYIFYIGTGNASRDGSIENVGMSTDSLKISEGATLLLSKVAAPGMAGGVYAFDSASYQTTSTVTGALTITHLDTVKLIVSATFHFNAVSKNGDTVKITNGRFDVHYMP